MNTTTSNFDIKEISWPARTFLTVRKTVTFDKLSAFFAEHYGAMYAALGRAGVNPQEAPFAIYFSIDEKNNQTDLAAAVPVPANIQAIEDYEKYSLPASRVITTLYKGSYENMRPAYTAMDKYLADRGLKCKLMLEQYLSDPVVDKNPDDWKTNIFFVVE